MRKCIFILLVFFALGCNNEGAETTTSGKLHIYIPESISPVMIDEVNEFLNLYEKNGADITYTVVPTETSAAHFLKDTGRVAFLPRTLTSAEKGFAKKTTDLNELVVAYDGIIAVVHPKNNIEQMTTTEIKNILTGQITKWEQLSTASRMKGTIKIYCQDSSDITEYLVQRLTIQNGIKANFKHTASNNETVQCVENDRLSLGFTALSWTDPKKATIKVLNLGRTKEDTDTTFAPSQEVLGKFFPPIPAYIYLNHYPLKRAITMYTRAQINLAAGFGTYVATVEGQKIFLKHGLLPATQKIKLKAN
jgi:phosphate transport system substrate-binding protein